MFKIFEILFYLSKTNQPEVGYYPSQKSTKCEMRSDQERICQNGGQTDFQTAVALEKVGDHVCFLKKSLFDFLKAGYLNLSRQL